MKALIISALVVVVVLGGYLWYTGNSLAGMEVYKNPTYGISFKYSDTYELGEREVGNGERYQYAILLADKELLANLPDASEGPPTITIQIFQNDIDKLGIENWVKNSSYSNYKLSPDGVLDSMTVAGAETLHYTWDGLYRGESYVFANRDNIVMMSVTYLSQEDQIRKDFAKLISSLSLY